MPVYTPTTSLVVSGAGLARFQYALLDANGLPEGVTGAISNGSDAGFSVHVGVKKGGGSAAEPRKVVAEGDNGRFRHQYIFQAAELGDLEFTFAALSLSALAAMTGTKVDLTNAEWAIAGAETDKQANAAQMCLIQNVDAQDANAGTDGQQRFLNWIYPQVVMVPLFSPHEEASAADWSWKGIPTRTSKAPWGTSFTNVTNGFTKAARLLVNSVYPLTMHTFVGNGATASFTLSYSPASDTTGYSIKAWNATTGAPVTISSVNIATRLVTLASAPAAGVVIVVMYEAFDLLLN